MKSKSIQMSDYQEIKEEVRSLLRCEAEFRGMGITFTIPHTHRYWEYGSALAALRGAAIAPPARILDVGCGHGPFVPWLAKLHYRVDEIDPSPNVASRVALGPAMKGLDWAFASTPLLDFKPGAPYDAVFALSVIEHMPKDDQPAAWAKFGELVAPGGLLFLTMDYGADDASNKEAREVIFDAESVQNLIDTLTSVGFSFEDVDKTYHGAEVFDYTFFRLLGRKRHG